MNYCYDHYCCRCFTTIPKSVYNNSFENVELPLCITCQNWFDRLCVKPTSCAKKLFRHLRERNIKAELESKGKFKTVDITVESALVHIEVDGSHHNLNATTAIKDLWRTYYSMKEAYFTLRIPNAAIRHDIETTVKIISGIIIERKKQLKRFRELQFIQSRSEQQKIF
ncbi:MAG TPA: DUF559 domain-containing protein [Puia sp.]|nr:DUF559 domain-containing protein [Puia sp.]